MRANSSNLRIILIEFSLQTIRMKAANKKPRGKTSELRLRREQDSNLRTGFAGYTLSRRASSTTRAPLLRNKQVQRYE